MIIYPCEVRRCRACCQCALLPAVSLPLCSFAMRVAGLLALLSALVASSTASAINGTHLEARNCARLPNGPDPDVRDEIYLVALDRGVNDRVMHAMMATAIVESIVCPSSRRFQGRQ